MATTATSAKRVSGRSLALLSCLCLAAIVVPAAAEAAIAARATAAQRYAVVRWTAVAVGPGVPAGTGALASAFARQGKVRVALFDIVNTGTSALSGLTLTASATTGIAPGTGVSFIACTVPWVNAGSGRDLTCTGSATSLGTLPGGNGSLTVSRSLAVGERLAVRADASAPDGSTGTAQVISVKVARAQAAPRRDR